MNTESGFHRDLKSKMDLFVNRVYDCTAGFPKEEMYGVTSQLRRAALSVILNYIEGFARQHEKVLKNFLGISFGSLKESKYLIYFSRQRNYLSEDHYQELIKLSDEIGAMVWGTISKM